MIHPASPVAEATSGHITEKYMADVIDALKRLERVGSENSKTTEKLINAASALSRKIVEQFSVSSKQEYVTVVNRMNHWPRIVGPANEVRLGPEYEHQMHYVIEQLRLKNQYSEKFVDESRDAALAFSKDIANGLLDHIETALVERSHENQEGLAVLEAAANKIDADKEAAGKRKGKN